MDLAPPRGTRDFYPDDLRARTWLFDHFRAVAREFGFEEYDAPVLEMEELYTRKAGEEITQQLYCFEDKGGRRVALRPEMTPSLARLVLQKGRSLSLPVKWFSIPQCWRYERTTRGRRREHYQWNMDVFGIPDVRAEAELLAAVVSFFRRVGLGPTDVGIKISSRKVLGATLSALEVPEDRFAAVCVLVDKLEKVPREAIEGELEALGLSAQQVDRIVESLTVRSLDALAESLGPESEAVADLRTLFDLAGRLRLRGLARARRLGGPGSRLLHGRGVRGLRPRGHAAGDLRGRALRPPPLDLRGRGRARVRVRVRGRGDRRAPPGEGAPPRRGGPPRRRRLPLRGRAGGSGGPGSRAGCGPRAGRWT